MTSEDYWSVSSESVETHNNNGLGSVRGLYDDALAEGYVAQYAPYGEIWDSSGTDTQPFKFTGEILDGNGLQYHPGKVTNGKQQV